MGKATDICFLDYLVGTLATAYKGLITSLIARDFCITAKDDTTEFKGTVISIPEGKYIICLMQGGIEITRDEIREGFFRLTADLKLIETAGNLQLDIVQNGRHIGTFLLKKETVGGIYASAIEKHLENGVESTLLLDDIRSLDIHLLDREKMLTVFFDTLTENISLISDKDLTFALSELKDISSELSVDARRIAVMNITALLKILLAEQRGEACRMVLEITGVLAISDDILLSGQMASSILAGNDEELFAFYKKLLRGITVPPPKVYGLSRDTWAEIVNPSHLRRLSAFLGIIAADNVRFMDILTHLISNLFISGVWIPDDRLFQRDISSYLNSGVPGKNFLLHYMLLKKFPSYFSEVGASGRIRELTTDLDSWGNDTVLYFLRKQVHVNAKQ